MMKLFILKHTKIYLLLCWLLLWGVGSLFGLPAALNSLLVLAVGYLANVLWLMRLASGFSPQTEKAYRSKKSYSCTLAKS